MAHEVGVSDGFEGLLEGVSPIGIFAGWIFGMLGSSGCIWGQSGWFQGP